MRKATSADIDRLAKRTKMNHDLIAGGNMDDVGRLMVGSGPDGEAFGHIGMNVGDIHDLLLDDAGTGGDGGEDETGCEGDSRDGGEAQPPQRKMDKWFDRDRAVNAAVRQVSDMVSKIKLALESKTQELRSAVEAVKARVRGWGPGGRGRLFPQVATRQHVSCWKF